VEAHNDKLNKTRNVTLTALFSALLVVVRMFHVPFRMPGLGGVPWLVILLITPAFLSSRLSSTRISFIGGLIASFLLDTPPGPFHLIKYISAGLTIDLLHYILKIVILIALKQLSVLQATLYLSHP